jgi:hypothetical protein
MKLEKARIFRCGLTPYHLLSGAQRCLFLTELNFFDLNVSTVGGQFDERAAAVHASFHPFLF